ncbi:MAG TPA: hypothetical protein VL171_13285 [Verrucomicrobiae bacterium]|nr:hypothetical protein [Verrucomicrobiae bacterium]
MELKIEYFGHGSLTPADLPDGITITKLTLGPVMEDASPLPDNELHTLVLKVVAGVSTAAIVGVCKAVYGKLAKNKTAQIITRTRKITIHDGNVSEVVEKLVIEDKKST